MIPEEERLPEGEEYERDGRMLDMLKDALLGDSGMALYRTIQKLPQEQVIAIEAMVDMTYLLHTSPVEWVKHKARTVRSMLEVVRDPEGALNDAFVRAVQMGQETEKDGEED